VPSLPQVFAALAASAVTAIAAPAHAEEPACPMDMFEAAAGTWSTMIADSVADCLADPSCARGAGQEGATPAEPAEPAEPAAPVEQPPVARPPRPPRPAGRFADVGATVGVRSDARASDAEGGSRTGDGWIIGSGGVKAGWRGGPKACASGRAELGTESQIESGVGVAFPWAFVAVMLGGGQRWHVRPALSSPRVWLRRAFVESHVQAQMSFGVWRHGSGSVSAIVPARIETMHRRQIDGRPEPGVLQRFALAMYEHAGAATRVEVLRLALESFYPDGIPPETMPDTVSRRPPIGLMRFDPLVLALRRGAYELELDAGLLSADEPLACRGCAPVAGTLAAGVRRGDDTWHARYDRDAHLAIDARVLVEDRVSVRFRHELGRHAVRIDGFAALSRTTAAGEREPVRIGGVTVGVDAALAGGLELAVDFEAGRSFYARLDGDPAPVAEPIARLGVALSRSFGN
jgi:hypothetical protein